MKINHVDLTREGIAVLRGESWDLNHCKNFAEVAERHRAFGYRFGRDPEVPILYIDLEDISDHEMQKKLPDDAMKAINERITQ